MRITFASQYYVHELLEFERRRMMWQQVVVVVAGLLVQRVSCGK